jgi:hypothetical protein
MPTAALDLAEAADLIERGDAVIRRADCKNSSRAAASRITRYSLTTSRTPPAP